MVSHFWGGVANLIGVAKVTISSKSAPLKMEINLSQFFIIAAIFLMDLHIIFKFTNIKTGSWMRGKIFFVSLVVLPYY